MSWSLFSSLSVRSKEGTRPWESAGWLRAREPRPRTQPHSGPWAAVASRALNSGSEGQRGERSRVGLSHSGGFSFFSLALVLPPVVLAPGPELLAKQQIRKSKSGGEHVWEEGALGETGQREECNGLVGSCTGGGRGRQADSWRWG